MNWIKNWTFSMHKTHIILQHYQWIRQAELQIKSKSPYREVKHLIPASVICESLFSDARHIMTDFRRSMDPSTLEMLLILKYNKDLWDARTVWTKLSIRRHLQWAKNVPILSPISTLFLLSLPMLERITDWFFLPCVN